MSSGRALVAQANAVALPLRDESVDLAVFSPPYFSLRAYNAGPGEIGSEATPAEFLAALWQVMGEVKRVMKPGASAFVNLGDKYVGYTNGQGKGRNVGGGERGVAMVPDGPVSAPTVYGLPNKSLMGLPWAFALGCTGMLAALGGHNPGLDLILRAEIIWQKINSLPESVKDRVRRSHEVILHFTKEPRYYSAVDEVREPQHMGPNSHTHGNIGSRGGKAGEGRRTDQIRGWGQAGEREYNPLGKLPGSVWAIASEPLDLPGYFILDGGRLVDFLAPQRGGARPRPNGHHPGLFDPGAYREVVASGDGPAWRWARATGVWSSPWPQTDDGMQLRVAASHYAAFPSRLPELIVRGWSPPGVCCACGEGRWPVVDRGYVGDAGRPAGGPRKSGEDRRQQGRDKGTYQGTPLSMASGVYGLSTEATILGYACACFPAGTRVVMADGTRKPIEAVQVGDTVLTHTGNARRVVSTMRRPHHGPVIALSIEGLNGTVIRATPEHPFYAANKDYRLVDCAAPTRYKHAGSKDRARLKPKVDWQEAADLREGDFVSTGIPAEETPLVVPYRIAPPRQHATWPKGNGWYGQFVIDGQRTTIYAPTRPEAAAKLEAAYEQACWREVKVDAELAWLLGWYIAEGSIEKRNRTVTTFDLGPSEMPVAERLAEISARLFGAASNTQRRTGIRLTIGSYPLRQIVEALVGTGAHVKRLSKGLLTLPRAEQGALLAGWMQGDGYQQKPWRHAGASASESLIDQLCIIAERLEWPVVRRARPSNPGGLPSTRNAGPLYELAFNPAPIAASMRKFARDGMTWRRVTFCSVERYDGEVYNLEVEGDNSYQVEGINVHNCTPFTDHPGTGEPSGPPQVGGALTADGYALNTGGKPRQTSHPGRAGLWDKPKVGPWREYHLDRWTPPPTRPAVVADVFGGVGTTAMVAKALGRVGISLDLSHAYSRAARWRIFDSGQHGKALARTNRERQQVLL